MRTSSDYVVDRDNIFIVGVTIVIFHTHLCISCRCMLNNEKKALLSSFCAGHFSKIPKFSNNAKGGSKMILQNFIIWLVPVVVITRSLIEFEDP